MSEFADDRMLEVFQRCMRQYQLECLAILREEVERLSKYEGSRMKVLYEMEIESIEEQLAASGVQPV
jgi:hypothetical protein